MIRELKAILWKNLLIRKQHKVLTIFEILIPIVFFVLLTYGRSKVDGLKKNEIKKPTYYDSLNEWNLYSHLPLSDLQLWYNPYTEFTHRIVTKVQERFGIIGDKIRTFTTKEQMLKQFSKNDSISVYALSFRDSDKNKLDYDISIYDKFLTWNTDKLFPSLNLEQSHYSDYSKPISYVHKGFVALQIAVNKAFIEVNLNKNDINIELSLQQFPDPPHIEDNALNELLVKYLPLVTIVSFICLYPAVLQRVGEEKYNGTKEFLNMMGIKTWMLWFGWLVHALSTNIISLTAIIVLMKVSVWGVPYPLIEHSNSAILFLFLSLYFTTALTFCFFIATIMRKPNIATIIGILVWIISYFLPVYVIESSLNLSWIYKILFVFFPNVSLYYGYSAIAVYEVREIGVQWWNIFSPGTGDDQDVTMGHVFFMFLFDMFFYMLCTYYIGNVCPGRYGIPKTFDFPIQSLINLMKIYRETQNCKTAEEGLMNNAYCIEICNLNKTFHETVALDSLSMTIPKRQISVLLGLNGAGKSTLVSVLTGSIEATKGSIRINGKEMRSHTDDIRGSMGLCPQHDFLFDDLTVKEHLIFIAKLKGVANLNEKVNKILEEFELRDFKDEMPNILSGGMKRKLCLGMALVGDSDILILDEPTTGMDPQSRRKVWDLLLQYRKKKTILLITHFMEEAEVLADNVAIIANGSLQCSGTPIDLKNKYNTGYHLTLQLNHKETLDQLTTQITRFVPNAKLLSENNKNVTYLLSFNSGSTYYTLLKDLEENCLINSYQLRLTTLSDVFLRARDEIYGESNNIFNYDILKMEKNEPNLFLILTSLLLKRCYILKRKYYWYIPALIVTSLIMVLTFYLSVSNPDTYNYNGPSLNLDLSIYGKSKVVYGTVNSINAKLQKLQSSYKKILVENGAQPHPSDDVSEDIIASGTENIAFYKQHMIAAAEFQYVQESNQILVNAMYSSRALHSIPITINLAMNAIAKVLLSEDASIVTQNAPFSSPFSHRLPSELTHINVGTLWVILIPLAITLLMGNFIIFPYLELSTNFLTTQKTAGVNVLVYWITNIMFDSVICCAQLFLIFLVLIACLFNRDVLEQAEYTSLATMFIVYMISSLPFTYLFSYKKTLSAGFSNLLMLVMCLGLTSGVVLFGVEYSGYADAGKYLKIIFSIIYPPCALVYACLNFSQKYVENFNWNVMTFNKRQFICETTPNPCCSGETFECHQYRNYFDNKKYGIEETLYQMLFGFIVYFIIVCFIDSYFLEKVKDRIKNWRSRHSNDQTDYKSFEQTLIAKDLVKKLKHKEVVKKLGLKVEKNECFGLLGVNGAGKSTTLRMLSKTTGYDEGSIFVKAKKSGNEYMSVADSNYTNEIGFCSQENTLNYYLSGREMLKSIALIKGYSFQNADHVSESLIQHFDLEKYADKPCLEYSGGNKRKLCSCIAFLGNPNLIVLDEPTSGVDPASQRKFWQNLTYCKKNLDTSFLLASHSMEECEDLCDTIAIMKAGEIVTCGTLSKLKSEHQKGFEIIISLLVDIQNATDLTSEFKNIFDIKSEKNHGATLMYHVGDSKPLSDLFKTMEAFSKKYQDQKIINNYSISDISLEKIFLSVV